MTESEWLHATDPHPMLGLLTGRASERKLRLLHCACCRRVWDALPDERSRQAVAVVERYADGQADLPTLRAAALVATLAWMQEEKGFGAPGATAALWRLEDDYGPADDIECLAMVICVVQQLAFETGWVCSDGVRTRDPHAAERDERAVQARLLRDIFGPLAFRPLPAVSPDWLVWNEGLVRRLAEAAYEERCLPAGTLDPARLAVLADALEDAGCTDAELLAHLRGPGPHVRGCWAVDLLMGRE
jgi:hypothetical protein